MLRLNIARALVIVGFMIGLTSLYQTVSHIGDPEFLLVGGDIIDHGYYHFFREAGGDIAAMAVVLLFLFCTAENRTSTTWAMAMLVALGYYAPYWVGMPFNESLAAPHMRAEISHSLQAALVVTGLFVARTSTIQKEN